MYGYYREKVHVNHFWELKCYVSQLSTKFNEERIGLITDLLIQSPAHFWLLETNKQPYIVANLYCDLFIYLPQLKALMPMSFLDFLLIQEEQEPKWKFPKCLCKLANAERKKVTKEGLRKKFCIVINPVKKCLFVIDKIMFSESWLINWRGKMRIHKID